MGIYEWSEGSRFKGDAQKIGDELSKLGVLTPENIVKRAGNPKSAMHGCFTWDDQKAAGMWRNQEARMLVNAIVTVADPEDEDSLTFPAFESVVIGNTRQYASTTIETLTDDELWGQIAGDIQGSIYALQRKLKVYGRLRKEQADTVQHHLDLAREAVMA